MRRPPLWSISGSSRAFPRKAGNCSLETGWASRENFAHVVVGPWRLSQMPPAKLRPSSASGRKGEGAEKGEPNHVRGCCSFPRRMLETLFKCKQRLGRMGHSLRSCRDKRWDVSPYRIVPATNVGGFKRCPNGGRGFLTMTTGSPAHLIELKTAPLPAEEDT